MKNLLMTVIFGMTVSSTLRAQTPPSGFCQAKTDYDSSTTCSDEYFDAHDEDDLAVYATDFGLSGNEYKNIRIKFPLTGDQVILRSPCKISIKKNLTHTANNICLDGRDEVRIRANNLFESKKIHILSPGGATLIGAKTMIRADELEIFSSDELHLNKGTRLELKNNGRLVSTMKDDIAPSILVGPQSIFKAENLSFITNGMIRFNNSKLETSKDLRDQVNRKYFLPPSGCE